MTYRVVMMDPPWFESGGGKIKRGADRHYKLAKTKDLPAIIQSCPYWAEVDDDAHCYMWVTNSFLKEGIWLLEQLGFRYVTNLVWCKTRIGLGQYFRGQHEICLFGVRGKTSYTEGTWPTVLGGKPLEHPKDARGKRIHSRKPSELHEMIEAAEPGGYLELFGREEREGWTVWGNEIEQTLIEEVDNVDSHLRELSLFSGAGGGLLGTSSMLGWRTVAYVEWDAYAAKVLQARIKDGMLHDAPIWDDVSSFDGLPWRGCIDVISAGFPCQPFSVAGAMGASLDERNGWPATARVIRDVRPAHVYLENVAGLLAGSHGYFGVVLGELAALGYNASWGVLSAAAVGAPHRRDRLWIHGHTNSNREPVGPLDAKTSIMPRMADTCGI